MLSHLRNAIRWGVVMAFTAGIFATAITVHLFPAAATDATCPVKYPANGLMNVFPVNNILPG
jgi:hypothetical protein